MQRTYALGAEPRLLGEMISMNSPYADRYILSGVLPGEPNGQWRWANQRAELRFQLSQVEGQKLFVHFVIAGETFKVTGPLTMRFWLDGKPVGSMYCGQPGEKRFEVPAPKAMLRTGSPIVLAIEADKVWISSDQTKLGFLLISAGFTE